MFGLSRAVFAKLSGSQHILSWAFPSSARAVKRLLSLEVPCDSLRIGARISRFQKALRTCFRLRTRICSRTSPDGDPRLVWQNGSEEFLRFFVRTWNDHTRTSRLQLAM